MFGFGQWRIVNCYRPLDVGVWSSRMQYGGVVATELGVHLRFFVHFSRDSPQKPNQRVVNRYKSSALTLEMLYKKRNLWRTWQTFSQVKIYQRPSKNSLRIKPAEYAKLPQIFSREKSDPSRIILPGKPASYFMKSILKIACIKGSRLLKKKFFIRPDVNRR